MALEDGYHRTPQGMPTATNTLYDTPLRGFSGKSSPQESSSPLPTYSHQPFSPVEDTFIQKEQDILGSGEDERYDARDPRRLTPNLGLSFVSQIHLLKKEVENKDDLVGDLEESLHESKAESERLMKDLNVQKAEVKSVKNQMQSLEHDMLQALEDIAKERDSALDTVTDTRKRLEASKEQARLQQEEVKRVYISWQKEREQWESNKRKMEGKVHVVEERLKTMAGEMLAFQSAEQDHPWTGDEGMRETWLSGSTDVRSASRLSNRSLEDTHERSGETNFRASRMSGLHEMGGSKMSGLSLADELGEDDEGDFEDDGQVLSPGALPEEAQMLPKRYSEDEKARRVMGFHANHNEQLFGDESSGQHSMGIIEDYMSISGKRTSVSYTDTGTQFTPPSTPAVKTKRTDSISEKPAEQTERFANQSRKRIAIPSVFVEQSSPLKAEASKVPAMISTGSQTQEPYISTGPIVEKATESQSRMTAQEMRSTFTQTIEETITTSKAASTRLSSHPLDVPVIAIHPPTSRPSSSHNSVVLPPRTRNMACQVAIDTPRNLKSTSMQTEEIRIDKRPVRIPPRLQPTNLPTKSLPRHAEKRTQSNKATQSQPCKRQSQNPSSPSAEESAAAAPEVLKRKNKDVLTQSIPGRPSASVQTKAKGSHTRPNNSRLLSENQLVELRRPPKQEPISARSVKVIDDDVEEKLVDFSDDDDFADAVPIRKTLSKVQDSWKLVPQPKPPAFNESELASKEEIDEIPEEVPDMIKPQAKIPTVQMSKTAPHKPTEGYRRASNAAKPADIRRTALVSNGIAGHAQRTRSPSAASALGSQPIVVPPPFPVPTRSSSRKIPVSASDGAASPSPYSTSFFTTRRGQNSGKPPPKRRMLRKVQSAAVVSKLPTVEQLQIAPSTSAASTVPASPKSLPQGPSQFILPYDSVNELPRLPTAASQPIPHAGEAWIEPPTQQTSVVDAIAQTMVGEWMWKYVRKRTSFGITESPQAEFEMGKNGENGNSSGVRHKRWVWLAPYENAVIWSGKQPTSGPALLGKGGRKLMIQSVLDVKDDTPLPKNAGSQSAFDRSILILTPQRALKFTAVSRERHYIWLTALSFLSHSTRGMHDLTSLPPIPQQEYQPPPLAQESQSNFRRTPVRDSIRIAKAKSRPSIGPHSFSSPIGAIEQKIIQDTMTAWGDREPDSEEAAEPPQVPRVAAHARKRSSTGPRPVPLSAFHNYPGNSTAITSSFSLQAPTSRDKYDGFAPRSRGATGIGPNLMHAPAVRRITDTNRDSYVPPPPVVPDNFFDPVGTMRMEAFVLNNNENQIPEVNKAEPAANAKKESRSYRTRQGRKKDLSYWGVEEPVASQGRVDRNHISRDEDPFMGF